MAGEPGQAGPTEARASPPLRNSPRDAVSGSSEVEVYPTWTASNFEQAVGQRRGSSASSQAHACRSRWRSLTKYLVDPRRIFHRYFLLTLICFFVPGPYYHDCILSAYKGPISEAMDLSNKEFSMLFALSSLTGVFCGPFGLVIMRLGRTRVALAAGFVCALGSLFVVLGFEWKLFEVMLAGRIAFWLALYVLLMVQTLLVYSIFEGPAMKLACSLLVLSCRSGATVAFFVSGPLEHQLGLRGSLWLSVSLVFVAFAAVLLFSYLFRGTSTAQIVRPFLQGGRAPSKSFSVGLTKEIPRSVVGLLCAIGALYGTVFPFEVVADDMLQKEFGYTPDAAGFLLTAIPMVSLASPLVSRLVGAAPRQQLRTAAVAFAMLAGAQACLAVQRPWSPILGFGTMGFGYAAGVCALWIALPGLVRATVPADIVKEVEGLATGLSYAMTAAAQFLSNFVVGIIKDESSYRGVCLWLASVAGVGLLCVIASMVNHRPDSPGSISRSSSEPGAGAEEPAVADEPPKVSDLAISRSILQEDYYTS